MKTTKDTLQAILDRTSYRGRFQSAPIPREDLILIMETGLAAPSGCNKQTTSLLGVDDPVMLQKVKSVINPSICETAPALICVLTRKIIAYRDRTFHVQDYAAAIENMLVAIHAMGYESCWYEGHITDEDQIGRKIADLLGVPAEYDLVCLLPVGIAEEPTNLAKKPYYKKKFEERAWFNEFGKQD